MTDAILLMSPVVGLMLAAAIAILLRPNPRASEGFTLLALLAALAGSLALLGRAVDGTTLATTVFGGWPHGIGVGFAARLPGAALVTVTLLIAVAIAVYGHATIGARRRRAGHDALMLAMVAAVCGAFLTSDLFNLYVFFELALLAALGLVSLDRRESQAGAAMRYASIGILGATAILAGIGLLYGLTGTLHLPALAAALSGSPPSLASAVAAALMLGGFALKSGLVPFHVWLPSAYAPAPISVSGAFAGLLTKMGFYALLLILAGVFATASGGIGAAQLKPLLGWIAVATMLLCALGALAQHDMRRLLGYHVVAQVGYMMAGLATGTAQGVEAAVFYVIHSMIVQANLFLGAGTIHRATGSWTLERTGGMARANPIFGFIFAVPMLSLAGIPPLSGFWGKLLVFRAAIDTGAMALLAAALVAALLTLISVGAFWSATCWKVTTGRQPRPVPPTMLLGMAILSAATLAISLVPAPVQTIAKLSAGALARMGTVG
ncbi:proton-conducting transporter transmembrane domain-containing protein [Polymorphobacter sp.]|uniref:proton-conducting transporter transmembrane domain-containing protein n=1 Tax=Polymorphobacter sp. TaxID=1909290 RepID=UPI003F70B705